MSSSPSVNNLQRLVEQVKLEAGVERIRKPFPLLLRETGYPRRRRRRGEAGTAARIVKSAPLHREGRKIMGRSILVSLGLLVVALSLSGAKGCCPQEWFSRNGLCYKVFEEAKTWGEAEKYCKIYKHGCHLASLDTKEVSEDLAVHISQKYKINIWIGLSRPSHKDNWKWSDGSKFSYTSWNSGGPNHKKKNKNCVELLAGSGYKNWSGEKCASLRPFFCQCLV